ncbi:MAG: YfbM family protein [Pseudomonadota bacterium]|nr:YfbM family protein [Pseudomonadota bacterium]
MRLRRRNLSPEPGLFGGENFDTADDDYYIRLCKAEDVPAVATALEASPEDEFRKRHAATFDGSFDDDEEDEIPDGPWGDFEEVRLFFRKAANAGKTIIFTVALQAAHVLSRPSGDRPAERLCRPGHGGTAQADRGPV